MRKTLLTLTPFSLLLLAMTGGAQAASNTTVQITGNVVAATCDVSSSVTSLDLGNYTPADFSGVATPIKSSEHQFAVSLTNCQNPQASGDTANLMVSGATLAGNPKIFNTTGTNTGVMLSQSSATDVFIQSGQKLNIATATKTTDASDFNGSSLVFNVGMAASSAQADIGTISAPITFQFSYN